MSLLYAPPRSGFEAERTPQIVFGDMLEPQAVVAFPPSPEAVADRNNEVYRLTRDPETFEVTVESDVELSDYQEITREDDWQKMLGYAEELRGKSVAFINPTMEGGGVAMLRPPLVHILRKLGVDAHWFVMEPDEDVFKVTKKMHNISQRRLGDERLTDEEMKAHWSWNEANAEVLERQPAIQDADIMFIDDPQPAPLIELLKDKVKPGTKWVWRNHIDTSHSLMSDPDTPQGEVANYLLEACGVNQVDRVVCHPVGAFIHPGMEAKTNMAPATTEPWDDLNRELSAEEVSSGIEFINQEIRIKNQELESLGRFSDIQSEIDVNRKRIVLIARFDESKGMDHAMEIGARTRQSMREAGVPEDQLPQVILVGNGSVDDPSGVPMYEKMLELRRTQYPEDSKDIIIMRLKHNYSAMNALMHPTGGLDGSDNSQIVALQTSEAEGCETRISDWIEHGVPVLVYNNGGMPLQIIPGKSGYILDFKSPDHDTQRASQLIRGLLTDPLMYARMRTTTIKAAEEFNNREFTTTANVTRLLRTMHQVISGLPADLNWRLDDLAS